MFIFQAGGRASCLRASCLDTEKRSDTGAFPALQPARPHRARAAFALSGGQVPRGPKAGGGPGSTVLSRCSRTRETPAGTLSFLRQSSRFQINKNRLIGTSALSYSRRAHRCQNDRDCASGIIKPIISSQKHGVGRGEAGRDGVGVGISCRVVLFLSYSLPGKARRAGSCWALSGVLGMGAPGLTPSKLCVLQPVPRPLWASYFPFTAQAQAPGACGVGRIGVFGLGGSRRMRARAQQGEAGGLLRTGTGSGARGSALPAVGI